MKLQQVKQLHAFSLRTGLDQTLFLLTHLLRIPNFPYALKLFNLTPNPPLSLYNSFLQSFACHSQPSLCFPLYSHMLHHSRFPNPLTFTYLSMASSCLSSPSLGQMIHAHFVKFGFEYDTFAVTALIDMYAKICLINYARKQFDFMVVKDTPTWNSLIAGYARLGDMKEANELFSAMPSKNVVSWTTMIGGYSQNGQYGKSLDMFLCMEKQGLKPNEVTIASVLPACANLGASEIGERIGKYARDNGYLSCVFVCNGLLEMYAKCGKLDLAIGVFDHIGSAKNLCSWNSMIMALAIHGRCKQALSLFHQMLNEGTMPDDVTLVAALVACTHGGMMSEGQELFQSMEAKFKCIPKLEHYGCMVDLLGRAGKLNEAYSLIKHMPMKPDSVIWGTLLGACSFHGDVDVAEKAAEALFELEPWNSGNYVILSNIYASAKRWDGVAKLRKKMKSKQMVKVGGYSCIEEDGEVEKFMIEDKSHPRCDEIYGVLHDVYVEMMAVKDESIMDSEIIGVP